jgi:hypothetical protein
LAFDETDRKDDGKLQIFRDITGKALLPESHSKASNNRQLFSEKEKK